MLFYLLISSVLVTNALCNEGSSNTRRKDVVFLLDSSSSMGANAFRVMKDFVKGFLTEAHIDNGRVRVGVVTFSTYHRVDFHLNEYSTEAGLSCAVDHISYRYGSTDIYSALRTMRTQMFTEQNGHRAGVDKVAILITDGLSNIFYRRTIPEAERARAENIRIRTIGIGLWNTTEIDRMASRPLDENRFTVESASGLSALQESVFNFLCECVSLISFLQNK